MLLRPRIRVAVLLGQPDLSQTLLLALAAAPRPADGVVQLLDRIGGLLGLALVRRIGHGVVVRRLDGRAGTANHVASGNADGNVGVDRVLLGLGIRVGVLLGV